MSVLDLRVRSPAIIDVHLVEYFQRLKRNLIDLSRQTTDARTLGEFKEALGAVGFGQESDVDGLHGHPPLRVYHAATNRPMDFQRCCTRRGECNIDPGVGLAWNRNTTTAARPRSLRST